MSERIEGGIWGMLVGDALGVPYEFHPPNAIPDSELIDFDPPDGFERAHIGVAPGTWSDDGAHALCLLASLLHCDRLDLDDLANRLTNWYELGYMAVDNEVFDVGIQTSRALQAYRSGIPAKQAGPAGERDNGNGSLMRVLPLALWHHGTDRELAHDAQLQSLCTHGHVRAQVCCAFYCLWARRILDGTDNPWYAAATSMRAIYGDGSVERQELELHVRPDAPPRGMGSGYVLDSLHSARDALERGNYAAVVRAAIKLGNDTDTTACIAGGLAGIRHGVSGIPKDWLERLQGRDLVVPLVRELVTR
jgi:ADP-ribosylglycohydrolase